MMLGWTPYDHMSLAEGRRTRDALLDMPGTQIQAVIVEAQLPDGSLVKYVETANDGMPPTAHISTWNPNLAVVA